MGFLPIGGGGESFACSGMIRGCGEGRSVGVEAAGQGRARVQAKGRGGQRIKGAAPGRVRATVAAGLCTCRGGDRRAVEGSEDGLR